MKFQEHSTDNLLLNTLFLIHFSMIYDFFRQLLHLNNFLEINNLFNFSLDWSGTGVLMVLGTKNKKKEEFQPSAVFIHNFQGLLFNKYI